MSTHRETGTKNGGDKIPAVADLNGQSPADAIASVDVDELLEALQAMRVGNFAVRLPGNRIGIA